MFLYEILIVSKIITDLCEKFSFCSFPLEKVGREGGLAIMWKCIVSCQVVDSSYNRIDVHIMEKSNIFWRLKCFYGYPKHFANRNQEIS